MKTIFKCVMMPVRKEGTLYDIRNFKKESFKKEHNYSGSYSIYTKCDNTNIYKSKI